MSLRVKVFTVPGQVLHASTRRLVLQGADGVAFIADSQVARDREQRRVVPRSPREPEGARTLALAGLPMVIQFNKRDLPNVRTDDEIDELARRGKEPVFQACAINGRGRRSSRSSGCSIAPWSKLEAEHDSRRSSGIEPRDVPRRWRRASSGHARQAQALSRACVGGGSSGERRMSAMTPRRSAAARRRRRRRRSPRGRRRSRGARRAVPEHPALFGIGVRVYSSEGALLANVATRARGLRLRQQRSRRAARACGATVGAVKSVDPGDEGDVVHPCFTGLAYRIVSIDYEGAPHRSHHPRPVRAGRASARCRRRSPRPIQKLDVVQGEAALADGRRASSRRRSGASRGTSRRRSISSSSRGHKALLTSKLHLDSVRESYPRARGEDGAPRASATTAQGARSTEVELPRAR